MTLPRQRLAVAFIAILILLSAIAMAVSALTPGAGPASGPIIRAPAGYNLQKNVNA